MADTKTVAEFEQELAGCFGGVDFVSLRKIQRAIRDQGHRDGRLEGAEAMQARCVEICLNRSADHGTAAGLMHGISELDPATVVAGMDKP